MKRFPALRGSSLAMVAASVALFVAFGGTAYAAEGSAHSPGATVAKKKKPKPPANDNASDKALFAKLFASADDAAKDTAAISAYLAGHTVPNASHADNATNAGHASTADTAGHASTADSATAAGSAPPLAYGDFDGNGAVQANTAPPVRLSAANIDHITSGVYCLKDLSFTPKTAIVSADNSGGANFTIASVLVTPSGTLFPCNPGEHIRVRTVNAPGGSTASALTDEPFTIWLN